MRHLTVTALTALLLLGLTAPTLWADGEDQAAPKAAAADDEAKTDNQKKDDQEKDAEKEEEQEFHLDLRDVKDLRDADIRLPELEDEPVAPPVEPDDPEDPADQPTVKPEEGDLKVEKPEEPEEPEIDPRKLVKDILEGMEDSAQRLGEKKNTGQETQGVQKKVVDDLSELIKYVAQQQQQSSSSQSQQNQQSRRDSQQAGRGQRPQSSRGQGRGQRQGRRSQRPMQDEMATKGSVQEEERENVSKRLEDRWGDLLKNAPRETRQAIPGMILEKYRDLLSRYFYALARQAAEKREER